MDQVVQALELGSQARELGAAAVPGGALHGLPELRSILEDARTDLLNLVQEWPNDPMAALACSSVKYVGFGIPRL